MSKHTPGPWIAPTGLFDNRTDGPRIVADNEIICAVETVDPDLDDETNDRRLANARLIAGAPDAFEFVEFVALVSCGGASSEQIQKMGFKALEWLAKVRGES